MRYKSEIYEVIHQDAVANFEVGAIPVARMREYDEMCLVQEPEPAKKTAKTMEMEHISPVTAGV
jgi:putative transcriptional regulator